MREPEVEQWLGRTTHAPLMAGMLQTTLMTARLQFERDIWLDARCLDWISQGNPQPDLNDQEERQIARRCAQYKFVSNGPHEDRTLYRCGPDGA